MGLENGAPKNSFDNIDPLIPAEGQEKFKQAIETAKAEGLTGVRTTFFSVESGKSADEGVKKIPLQAGERVLERYTQEDDMEDFEPGTKPMDIEYVLIGKF